MVATSSQKVKLSPLLQKTTADWSEPTKRLLFPTSHQLSQRHVIGSGQLDLRGVDGAWGLLWVTFSSLIKKKATPL